MDVDTLEPGVDFVERINSAVGAADALLVVVGRGWLNAKNLDGERRLDDPKDFVRLEVGTALSGDPVVIPVLVGGATMPQEEELPPELAKLARRNAVTLSDADWRAGMGRLQRPSQSIEGPRRSNRPCRPRPTSTRSSSRVFPRSPRRSASPESSSSSSAPGCSSTSGRTRTQARATATGSGSSRARRR